MDLEFWNQRWQDNQIGFHQQSFNSHLQAYWHQMEIKKGACIFVPLCGKSLDMLWLMAQGYTVVGVECSSLAVKDFFEENKIKPNVSKKGAFECWRTKGLEILCGDFFALTKADIKTCAGIYDRASLVAFPPDMRQDYARHLITILPPKARMLLISMVYDQKEMEGPPFSVNEEEVQALYHPHFGMETLLETDILAETPQFSARGLTRLVEKVYRLSPKK